MKILVFDRDENLKGHLKNILLAVHTEEIHGDNILNIRTTDYLEKGYRLAYKDKYGIWHEFSVKGLQETHAVTEPVIDAYCEASFYELLGDYIEDKRPQGVPANTALARALEGTRWEVGFVDDLGSNTTNFYHISAMEAVYKVAEVWGGEIKPRIVVAGNKITHRYIDLLTRRGADRGKRFEFGKDISGIARYVQDDDIKTALYGYGMGEILENGEYGRRIDFAELNDGKAYVESLAAKEIWGRLNPDGTRSHVFGKVDFDAIEDPQELLEATIEELEKRSQPQISYEATVTDLKAYGYDHEGIELGDTVAVIDRGFPRELRIKARCIRYARDLIDETNNKITLGNFLPNFIDGELDQQRRLENIMARQGIWDKAKILDPDGLSAQYLKDLVQVLNNELNAQGGYVYLTDDGKGLITYDKPIDQDPTMAIQILGGAFRIANSKLPNGEWDWRTFGTGNGFTADEMIAGILRGGKVHFDLTNGTFLIGDSPEDYILYFDGATLKVRLGTGKTVEESLQDIQNYADTKASQAESAAKAYAELKAQEEVENLEIGGRNLFSLQNVTSYTPYNTSPTVEGTTITTTMVSADTGFFTIGDHLRQYRNVDQVYTASGFIKKNGEIDSSFFTRGTIHNQTETLSLTIDATTGYFVTTFRPQAGMNTYLFHDRVNAVPGDVIEIDKLTVVRGTKPADWTPAPEDVDEAISTVDTKYSNKVAEINTTIDGITQRVESTETNITTIDGTVSSLSTRMDTAEQKIAPTAIVQTVRQSEEYLDDLGDKVSKNNIISEINQSAEEVQINANRVKIGMGTTFEQGQIYTWNQYLGKTWNQMNS